MEIGQIISNKYKVLSLIGRGGTSSVYLAIDIETNQTWAIKEIKNDSIMIDYTYKSMIAEAELIRNLKHDGIPQIKDIVSDYNSSIIIMEYIVGKSLEEHILDMGTLSEESVIDIALQLTDVFKYIHSKGIIYRDLKPANIMLQPNGKIKLIDFGVARKHSPEKMSDTLCLGTVGYAAPEQYGGNGQTDFRADIYAFGVTLFYMLTGKNPVLNTIDKISIRSKSVQISKSIEYLILKCTQARPEKRYQNFTEIEQYINKKLLKSKNSIIERVCDFFAKIFSCKKKSSRIHTNQFLNNIPYSYNNYLAFEKMVDNNETTILSSSDLDYIIPPSVLDNQKIRIFLSYSHYDSDLADKICERFSKYDYIEISRYSTDVPYKGSFKEFMNSLNSHDKVILIISDQYLKSSACMYEVGQLISSPNYERKILFVVCTEEDKKHYKKTPSEKIEATIYNLHERTQYIIYWENECKKLLDDANRIETESYKIEILHHISTIRKNISEDIGEFLKYIANVNGISFDELVRHNYAEFLKELGIHE